MENDTGSQAPLDFDLGEGFEQYLEAIYQLREVGREASTSAIAEWLEVKMGSVTGMLKRMGSAGLIEYESYQPSQLTPAGRSMALRIVRRHRLWEVFLCDRLGVPWFAVYPPACQLEHATSEAVEMALERYLGNPALCPHGFPIPGLTGIENLPPATPLSALKAGTRGRVTRISERQVDLLTYLAGKGIAPGAYLTALEMSPFDGTVTVDVQGTDAFAMSQSLAGLILLQTESYD